jgi:hypothetical protein
MAAALYLRGDGLVSGRCAAWVWGTWDELPAVIDMTVVGRNARPPDGVKIHRVGALHGSDVRWRNGIPVTSPARTVVDFAGDAAPLELENALGWTRRLKLASDRQLREALDRAPANKAGIAVLRQMLAQPLESIVVTRSRYERKIRKLCGLAELPTPSSLKVVEGYEVDLCWPGQRLIVEFDGWQFHKDKFRSDRKRDAKLQAAGWRVIRFTADRVDHHSYAVVSEIAQALTYTLVTA